MTTKTKLRIRVPILARTLAIVLLCALAPLLVSWALTVPEGMRALEDTAKQNLQVVARVTATQLDQLFADSSRLQGCLATEEILLRFCQADDSQRLALAPQMERRLRQILSAHDDLSLLYIADSKGICMASTSPDMVGRDYRSTRLYMREALQGRQCISDLAVGITTKEPGVFLAGPILNANQQVAGALVMKLRGQILEDICQNVAKRVTGGFAALVDNRRVIICHPDSGVLYHTVGDLPPGTDLGVDPKLQYGVDSVRSLGMNALAAELQRDQQQGSLAWMDSSRHSQIAGFASMSMRPWKVIVAQPRSVFEQPMSKLRQRQVMVLIAAGLGSVALVGILVRRLVQPIKALSLAASKLAVGDWSARACIQTNDELGDLAHTFNDMVPRLQERTKMENALRLAMEIQRNLLPHKPPRIDGADVAGVSLPADQTGGDYYDFLDLSAWEQNTLAVAVGDVAGHGISAALLMTTARALLRSRATPPGNLAELIDDVNVRLSDDAPEGRFMTLMYMLIDCRARSVRLVSAGHDPVLCYSPSTDRFCELSGRNVPLAILREASFAEVKYANLDAGAILIVGTDGIWEMLNRNEESYGKERLCDVVRRHRHSCAQIIMDELLADLAAFRGDIPQQDDVTVVVIKFQNLPLPSIEPAVPGSTEVRQSAPGNTPGPTSGIELPEHRR